MAEFFWKFSFIDWVMYRVGHFYRYDYMCTTHNKLDDFHSERIVTGKHSIAIYPANFTVGKLRSNLA